MKYNLLALIVCLPFTFFAQNQDSLAVVREVDSLLSKSQIAMETESLDEALQLIEEARKRAVDKFGKMSTAYATCLHAQGRFYLMIGEYDEAKPFCIEAVVVRKKVLGSENMDYAKSLSNLATLHYYKGEYTEAEQLFSELVETWEKVSGKESQNYAMALSGLANCYVEKGEYTKAEPLFLEGKEIMAVLDKQGQGYAMFLSNLASLYGTIGAYNKAEPLYLEAKEIYASIFGKEHPDYVIILNNLGNIYWEKGEYDKIESLFLEAKEIRSRVLGEDHPHYALCLYNLASLYFEKGDVKRAEPLYLKAIDIQIKSLGKEHIEYANSLTGLAVLNIYKGDYAKADSLYLEVGKIREEKLGKGHIDYARFLNNQAVLNMRRGYYAKAEPLFLKSIETVDKNFGKENLDYATFLQGFGEMHYNNGNYDEAEQLFLEAQKILEKIVGQEHQQYASSLFYLALLYQEKGDVTKSSLFFTEMNALIHRLIKQSATYSSENQMLAYLQFYEDEIAQFHHFVQENPNPALVQATYDNALFYNGFLLENYSRLFRLFAQADGPVRETLEQWQDYRRSLIREKAKPVAERKAAHITEWEGKAETLEKALMRDMASYAEFTKQVTWQDVQKHLKPSTAAIEFISYRYHTGKPADSTMYAALVLLPDEAAPHFIPLFEERQLKPLFNLTHKDIYSSRSELRRLLWQPIEPLLRDVKTVYYAPSGLLHNINPAALLDETGTPISTNRQWVRVGSTRHLVANPLADQCFARTPADAPATSSNQPAQARHPGRQTAIIYGGIEYNMDSLAFKAANSIGTADSTGSFQSKDSNFRSIMEERNRGNRGGEEDLWEPLKSSDIEADEVNAILQRAGFRTEVQKGLAASEERIKKIGTSEPSPRVLHLATHGFAYPDPPKSTAKGLGETEPTYKLMEDPMMRSGLVLAGANHYWKNKRPLTNCEDGALVAYEVRDLNLQNTELVVLSACKSGLGDAVSSEGLYGLQRAFRIAGVKFLIVSLWDVPDVETRKLMGYFYQNWLEKKESLRDAFYHAQQTLREKGGDDPFIWAGFVLVE